MYDAEAIRKLILAKVAEPVMLKHGFDITKSPLYVPSLDKPSKAMRKVEQKVSAILRTGLEPLIGTPLDYKTIGRKLVLTDEPPLGDPPMYDTDADEPKHIGGQGK